MGFEAILAFGASIFGSVTIFGATVSTLWVMGAALALSGQQGFSISSPNYSLDPVRNTLSGSVPVPIAYGKNRIGGNIFYQQFHDDTKETMYCHVALSEGPIVSGGISAGDIMINDFTTAELGTVTKESFEGTADQSAGTYDPDGLAYPYLAYVSLKMEASEKVQGTPIITTVFNGRDIEYPGKDAVEGEQLDCDTTATADGNQQTYSSSWLGYNDGTPTACVLGRKCWGLYNSEKDNWTYAYVYNNDLAFDADTYVDVEVPNILYFPFVWIKGKTGSQGVWSVGTFRIRVFPDSTDTETYYDFADLETDTFGSGDFLLSGEDGTSLHWELRRVGGSDPYGYSGMVGIYLPAEVLPVAGNASIVITRTSPGFSTGADKTGSWQRFPNRDEAHCGLLPYDDVLTDDPWSGWFTDEGINNPAWVLYDLLTNTRYGAGIDAAFIDYDSFATVAAQCTAEGLTFNFVFDRHQPMLDHIQEVLSHFRGWMIARDKIYIGMDTTVLTASASITEDDILLGSFSWWEAPSDQTPNWISVEYIDGDGEDDGGTWERMSVDAIDYDDIAQRGVVQTTHSLLGISNKAQAEKMADYLLAKAKLCQVFCQFSTMLDNSDIEVGDVVAITYDLPGWTARWVRVISVTDGPDGTITIVCNVYDADVYSGLEG